MIKNEIDILRKIIHPNIVKLHEEFETTKEIYLVMELVAVSYSNIMISMKIATFQSKTAPCLLTYGKFAFKMAQILTYELELAVPFIKCILIKDDVHFKPLLKPYLAGFEKIFQLPLSHSRVA